MKPVTTPTGVQAPASKTSRRLTSHGNSLRPMVPEAIDTLSGHGDPGKFGRMFPGLEPLHASDKALEDLAMAMVDTDEAPATHDNPGIPTGFTYFGQFVDHDITLDTTPLSQQDADPLAVENFRSPALDLDSLYSDGPAVRPDLYERALTSPYAPTGRFLVGETSPSAGQGILAPLPNDLPRNRVGRALIGDERNDENLIVAQTHLAFMKFHNAVMDHLDLTQPSLSADDKFTEARRIVTWHYQWIVLFDWVERLTEPGLINKIKDAGRKFYRFKKTPYIPVEFSAAAYRLGHSMVRNVYNYNRVFNREAGALAPATLSLLFGFTAKSGGIVGDLVDDPNTEPNLTVPGGKLRDLPGNWVIDWRRFYDLDDTIRPDPTRDLDAILAQSLHALPGMQGPQANLAFRNLKRGVNLGLPSGQAVANAMGVQPLTGAQVAKGPDGAAAKKHGLHEATPLWFYILKEAEVLHDGKRLGPVGSTIIAETFLGLVHGDQRSFLWQRHDWTPELPRANPETFTMADLLRFVDDINPIGDGT